MLYYALVCYLIWFSLLVLTYCALWVYDYIRERTERQKAAIKAAITQKVHDEWTVEKNRQSLWQSIEK